MKYQTMLILVLGLFATGCQVTPPNGVAHWNDGPVEHRYLGVHGFGVSNYPQHIGIWKRGDHIITFYTGEGDDPDEWAVYLRTQGWIPLEEYADVYERIVDELGPDKVSSTHTDRTSGRIPVQADSKPAEDD